MKCGYWSQLAVAATEEKQYSCVGFDDFKVHTTYPNGALDRLSKRRIELSKVPSLREKLKANRIQVILEFWGLDKVT